ncbi:hypothetical protein CYMTET_33658 [Cymbomonas tetramitiformis]|uniref:Uncharacterized protein n=1 Tax=Cymbomonas tetramitiformis TaxID=36881 RepID=A0AAE0FD82_9CHLO|nr:hypothetical protein CYMTET_33658 [Cymbomonas tetramitiformis]
MDREVKREKRGGLIARMASSYNDSKRERLELVGARLAKALGGEPLQGEGAVPVHSLNNSVWRGDHVKPQQRALADAGAMPLEEAGAPCPPPSSYPLVCAPPDNPA